MGFLGAALLCSKVEESSLVLGETQGRSAETLAFSLCSGIWIEITPFKSDFYRVLFHQERGQYTE